MPEGNREGPGDGAAPRAPAALHERLGLRFRVFLFFAALAAGALGALGLGLWAGYRHLGDPSAAPGFVLAGAIAGFATLGLVTWIWYLFDEHVARAIARLAGGLRAEAHAGVAGALGSAAARYLGDLSPAARAMAERLSQTRDALAEAVARETTRLAGEKARLETLLSDVPVGVLLCTAGHQLVFYNGPASEMLGAEAAAAPGLDRRVFDYLRADPLRHAHDRLAAATDADAVSDLMVATLDGARILSGRMRLLGKAEGGGYVLTLRDVTADLAAHAGRERLLAEVFDRIRRPAANLATVIGARADAGADAGPAQALDAAMQAEAAGLARAINELAARHDAARAGWWPLPMTRGADLIDGLRARIEARGLTLAASGADLILRCDGYAVVALLDALAGRMAAQGIARDLTLDLAAEGAGAMISLGWTGEPLDVGALDRWLAEPLEVGAAEMTARAVLDSHATECWPEPRPGGGVLRLPILEARIASRRPPPLARHVVYDFDLLFKARDDRINETLLEDLTYVVFDTETTGLLPAEGDEVVQIAGLRIVNGRIVAGEVFDRLVNPGRSIPPRATAVHGISEAMVAEAPAIAEVGRQFHHFAEGAVLVAHNAPFDMAFLRRHEAAIGRRFDNPILDTVLLSAVVWGQTEIHSLDALGHRLGITIPEEARHTAIGDAVATAEALLRLIPMLKGRGITRFGDVLAEVRKHGRLLKDLNA